ncbi:MULTISPECIES: hypothetical protein [Gordonia]|uniref:hypothetical protein n=1 Tax=Gordonia TaxID=2053 RepID=UPI0002A64ED3|nr:MULTISPECIES: hypothetical protein [Gordonia]ATD70472.1 hypothetical protein CNO18_09475 [Gordonia sp. 1D]MCZ4581395.1 hypothetical protein [Gordonia amicalis]MCZ4654158.1 hypothetical protein [Gordonia amicalis]MDJ0453801.1 hypothetical protein [Gordonia amicalis]MDV7076724.1 hypothetical protein [Gordonia amicalis]
MSAPENSGDLASDAVDTEKDVIDADLPADDEDATVEIAPEVLLAEDSSTDDAAPVEEAPVEEATAEDTPVDAPVDEATTEQSEESDADDLADAADLEGVHVSSRVRVTLEDGTTREGEIVDDFADLAPGDQTVEARIDEDHTARLRRWAISTDDHDIVFADDDAVELLNVS